MRSFFSRGLALAGALTLGISLAACGSDAQSGQSGTSQSGTSQAQSGVDASTGLSQTVPVVDRSGNGNFPDVTFNGDVPTIQAGSGEAPNQVMVKVLKEGNGALVQDNHTVLTDYVGAVWDGTVFDSSYEQGKPVAFGLSQVISGWRYALADTHVGDTVEIVIPPQYGYGSQSVSDKLPANSTLVFVVTVHDAQDPKDTSALSGATFTGNALPVGIEVGGEIGKEPTLTFTGSNTFTQKSVVVVAEGSGKTITENDSPLVYIVGGTYPTASSVSSTWSDSAQVVTAGTTDFLGQKVGSRLLMIYPSTASTSDSSESSSSSGATVLVVDIVGALSPQ